jgi:quercetin dioxygenase-like cupin family protein
MKRALNQPEVISWTIYAGIAAKTWSVMDAETLLPQHSHQFPHISYIVKGGVRVWQDEECLGDFYAPHALKIPAHAKHSFLTLSDDVVILCIHNADHLDAADEPLIAEDHNLDLED